jgi:hypothetical protein
VALFSFQRAEVDDDGQPTADTMAGALLWAELQRNMRDWVDAHRKK